MKIQFLNGGLANQAFQYIFARHYELSHPGETMFMDDSYFALNTVHNGYELEKVFGIRPHMLSECFEEDVWAYMLEQRKTWKKSIPQILCDNGIPVSMVAEKGDSNLTFNPFDGNIVTIPSNLYCPEIMDYPGDVYYHGYWINREWFAKYKDVFQKEFVFQNTSDAKAMGYAEEIKNGKSVAIHIRRGDFVTLGWAYQTENYRDMIERFMETMTSKWHLFVFSDDLDWCRENRHPLGFDSFEGVTFVEGNDNGRNYLDMWLMSQCRAMIMSNSSFCYLAALLNDGLECVINPTSRDV